MRQPRQFGLSFSSLVAGSGVAALVLVVVLVLVLSERTHERLPSVSLPAPPPPVIASIDERRADGAPADRPSAHAREETPTPPRIPLRADPPPAIPAWERYAVAAPQRNGRPWVAIVVDDMGLDRSRSARVIALPGPLTLAFLPYARDLERQTAAARAAGHELLLHLPMEPEGSENPGPDALRTDQDDQEILRRTVADLERFGSYVGVNNHMGSRFTRDARAMRPVMAELARRGLLFLDSRTASGSVGGELARTMGVPHVSRDVFLDHDPDPAAIRRQFAELEAIARRGGSAVGIRA